MQQDISGHATVGASIASEMVGVAPRYYDWLETFPQLKLLLDNLHILKEEASHINKWSPWPEQHYSAESETDWTVYPFLHTFPAVDTSKSMWIESTCAHCPKTVKLLRQVKDIRTALFSKLGPRTKLSSHTGWEDLANHVLRCHISIKIPTSGECGMVVEDEIQLHKADSILVFDDSKRHKAFNNALEEDRVVLIVDLMRPSNIPLGKAVGGHTDQLDSFISQFK